MQRNLLLIVMLTTFAMVTIIYDAQPAEEIRVWGGKVEDFKDSDGRVWHGGQNEKKTGAVGSKSCLASQKSKISRKMLRS